MPLGRAGDACVRWKHSKSLRDVRGAPYRLPCAAFEFGVVWALFHVLAVDHPRHTLNAPARVQQREHEANQRETDCNGLFRLSLYTREDLEHTPTTMHRELEWKNPTYVCAQTLCTGLKYSTFVFAIIRISVVETTGHVDREYTILYHVTAYTVI